MENKSDNDLTDGNRVPVSVWAAMSTSAILGCGCLLLLVFSVVRPDIDLNLLIDIDFTLLMVMVGSFIVVVLVVFNLEACLRCLTATMQIEGNLQVVLKKAGPVLGRIGALVVVLLVSAFIVLPLNQVRSTNGNWEAKFSRTLPWQQIQQSEAYKFLWNRILVYSLTCLMTQVFFITLVRLVIIGLGKPLSSSGSKREDGMSP
jgi:hypothetical protein